MADYKFKIGWKKKNFGNTLISWIKLKMCHFSLFGDNIFSKIVILDFLNIILIYKICSKR